MVQKGYQSNYIITAVTFEGCEATITLLLQKNIKLFEIR